MKKFFLYNRNVLLFCCLHIIVFKRYYEFFLFQAQRKRLSLYSHYIAPTTVNFLISKHQNVCRNEFHDDLFTSRVKGDTVQCKVKSDGLIGKRVEQSSPISLHHELSPRIHYCANTKCSSYDYARYFALSLKV